MREFARPDGRLAYLTADERQALFSDLVAVINKHKVYSVSASITEEEFRAFFPSDRLKGVIGAASLAFAYCLTANCNVWDINNLETSLAYLVSQSKESSQLEEMHRLFSRWEEERKTSYIGSITFDSHKRVYALQAADMIAWSNRRKILGQTFDSGFQPLDRLTRTVAGEKRHYPHYHLKADRERTEDLAKIINEEFPELPKIGVVPLVLDSKDVKRVNAALRQSSKQRKRESD